MLSNKLKSLAINTPTIIPMKSEGFNRREKNEHIKTTIGGNNTIQEFCIKQQSLQIHLEYF